MRIDNEIKKSSKSSHFALGLTTNDMKEFIVNHSNDLIKKTIFYHKNFDKVYENEYQLIHYICEYCDFEIIDYMCETRKINLHNCIDEEKKKEMNNINKNDFYYSLLCDKPSKLSLILRKRKYFQRFDWFPCDNY